MCTRKFLTRLSSFLIFISLLSIHAQSQRVGIGTNSPLNSLHIESSESSPLRIATTGITNAQAEFYLNGSIAGNVGLASDRMVLMARNNRILALGTQNFRWMHISLQGNVGLGTETPAERLTIANGNFKLENSNRGIILNASDRPMITRGFDAFTSGAYEGLGRWGLFMEPTRLTFGIPDVPDRAFQWSRYAANSTRTPLMTLDNTAKLSRPAQGGVDLLPIAIGSLSFNGTILGGSGNFTVQASNDGYKDVTISGVSYNTTQYVAVVNCVLEGVVSFAMTQSVDNKLRILTYNQSGTPSNRPVQFVVYKLF
jgi:hypothetical protein